MPSIAEFNGIVISIYWEIAGQHHLPHIHARYAEYKASYKVPGGSMIVGKMPRSQNKRILKWMKDNEKTLGEMWELASEGNPFQHLISELKS